MNIKEKATDYLKALAAETVSNAKSGHTGSALGASSIMLSLFHDHLKFDSEALAFWKEKNLTKAFPDSPLGYLNRDRLILSAGHTSAMLYSLLFMFGFDVDENDLRSFRKYGSKTPGHPEYGVVPSAETTTGPLGQGVANAVGIALAQSMLNKKFGDLFDYHTYCYAGEGCLMEGVAVEACSLAGTLNLKNLIILYDDNGNTIDGQISLENRENVAKKFDAMGFKVISVDSGNDYDACSLAIGAAKSSDKPVIIIFKTIIGIGTKYENSCKSHAMPLPSDELSAFKQSLGISESFQIPNDVKNFAREATEKNLKIKRAWTDKVLKLKSENPSLYEELQCFFTKNSINSIDFDAILRFLKESPICSGREISSKILNEIAKFLPSLVGGTGDVAPSTMAYIDGGGDFSAEFRDGRNIHFGIREHSMGAVANGLSLSGFDTFDSTFMAFSNYMIPPIKMRAMMGIKVLSVFSHDSIDVGQDGPTHQPIEQIGALRQIVGLDVFRPATEEETAACYKQFLTGERPVALVISKSKLSRFEKSTIEGAMHGGYVIYEGAGESVIEIFATGKEVALATLVARKLNDAGFGVRVISMPCEELFDRQPNSYKKKVLCDSPVLKVAIEASDDTVWYKYIGAHGLRIGVDDYQKSGDGNEVYEKAGFNEKDILKKIKSALNKKGLLSRPSTDKMSK